MTVFFKTTNQLVLESYTLSDGFHTIVKVFLLKYKEKSTWPEMLMSYFLLLHNFCHQQKLLAGSKKRKLLLSCVSR